MICKSFCDIDFSGICDKYCFKIIALCPQLRCFFKSHDEEGSGQTVTGQTVIPDNGDRPQATVSRIAGGRIHDMPVDLTVVAGKIAFIATRSNHCLIFYKNTAQITVFFCCTDTNKPVCSVCFCSNTWAEEKRSIKFTVKDGKGYALANVKTEASSNDSTNCKIENPIGFTDQNGQREIRVTLSSPGTFSITVQFSYTDITKTETVKITVTQKENKWDIKIEPGENITVNMPIPHNFTSFFDSEDFTSIFNRQFVIKEEHEQHKPIPS